VNAAAPLLRCIVGPTAAGKSAIAMAIAEARSLAIISADSRQLYRGFDIGTAKPTAIDLSRVPHYGIDVTDPTERYSAHRWATEACEWIASAYAAGTPPLIVGGTGLYLRALVSPLDAIPTLDPKQRAQLEPLLAAMDAPTVQRWCERLDPLRAHLGRTQRLRAIETVLLTGRPLSAALGTRDPERRDVRYLVVDPGAVLATRIAQRVEAMLAAGFRDEIDRLMQAVPATAPAWQASGYGVLRAAREGVTDEAEAIERVIIETRQYAKRQRTWFRHQLPAEQVTALDPMQPDALERALAWWDATEREGTL
jgi:tRNA dimethylallyltransferase